MINNLKVAKQQNNQRPNEPNEIEVVVLSSSEDDEEENIPLGSLIYVQKKSQSKTITTLQNSVKLNSNQQVGHEKKVISERIENVNESKLAASVNISQLNPNAESTPKRASIAQINETNWPDDKTQQPSLPYVTILNETIDKFSSEDAAIRTHSARKTVITDTQLVLNTQPNVIPETQMLTSNETTRSRELKRSNHDRSKNNNNNNNNESINFSASMIYPRNTLNIYQVSSKKQRIESTNDEKEFSTTSEENLTLNVLIKKITQPIKNTVQKSVGSSGFDSNSIVIPETQTQSSNETTRSKELKRNNHDRSKNNNNNDSVNSNESLIIQKNKKYKYNSNSNKENIKTIAIEDSDSEENLIINDTTFIRTSITTTPNKNETRNDSKPPISNASQTKIQTTVKIINESATSNTPKRTQLVINDSKHVSQKKSFINETITNEKDDVTMINASRITSTPIRNQSTSSNIKSSHQYQPKAMNSQESNEISMISLLKSTHPSKQYCQAELRSSMQIVNETNYSAKKQSFQKSKSTLKVYIDETNEDIEINNKDQSVMMIASPSSYPKTQRVNETKHHMASTQSQTPKKICMLNETSSTSKNRSINSNENRHRFVNSNNNNKVNVNDLLSSDEYSPHQNRKEIKINETYNSFVNKKSFMLTASPLRTQIVNETKNPANSHSQLVLKPNKNIIVNETTIAYENSQPKSQRSKDKENSPISNEKQHQSCSVNKIINDLFSSDESLLNNSDEKISLKSKQKSEHKTNKKNVLHNSNVINIDFSPGISEKITTRKDSSQSVEIIKQNESNTEINNNNNKKKFNFDSKDDKSKDKYYGKDLKASNKKHEIDTKSCEMAALSSSHFKSDENKTESKIKNIRIQEKTQNSTTAEILPKEDRSSNLSESKKTPLEELSSSRQDETIKIKKLKTINSFVSNDLFKKPDTPATTAPPAKDQPVEAADSVPKQEGIFFNGIFIPLNKNTNKTESKIRIRLNNSSNKTANLTANKSTTQSVNSSSSSTSMSKTDRFDLKKFLENSFKNKSKH